jgi:hypothetical protein
VSPAPTPDDAFTTIGGDSVPAAPANGPLALAEAADNPNLSPAARAEAAQLAENLVTSSEFDSAVWAAPDDVEIHYTPPAGTDTSGLIWSAPDNVVIEEPGSSDG